MKNHFYHIMWPPLNVTIFIMHVRILHDGRYANANIHLFFCFYHFQLNRVLIETKMLKIDFSWF